MRKKINKNDLKNAAFKCVRDNDDDPKRIAFELKNIEKQMFDEFQDRHSIV